MHKQFIEKERLHQLLIEKSRPTKTPIQDEKLKKVVSLKEKEMLC